MIKATVDASTVTEVDLKFSKAGKAWAKVRVASNERKKDQAGKWIDGDPTFFDVTCFGRQAEMLAESNPAKGTRLLVSGKMYLEQWEDREGNKRESLRMTADNIALDLLYTAYEKISAEQSARGSAARADAPAMTDEAPF